MQTETAMAQPPPGCRRPGPHAVGSAGRAWERTLTIGKGPTSAEGSWAKSLRITTARPLPRQSVLAPGKVSCPGHWDGLLSGPGKPRCPSQTESPPPGAGDGGGFWFGHLDPVWWGRAGRAGSGPCGGAGGTEVSREGPLGQAAGLLSGLWSFPHTPWVLVDW